jgi:hypothetical protein
VRLALDGGTSAVGGVRILVRRVLARLRCLRRGYPVVNYESVQ